MLVHRLVRLYFSRGVDVEALARYGWYLNPGCVGDSASVWILEIGQQAATRKVQAWGCRPSDSQPMQWRRGDKGLHDAFLLHGLVENYETVEFDRALAVEIGHGRNDRFPAPGRYLDGRWLAWRVEMPAEFRAHRVSRFLRRHPDDALTIFRFVDTGVANLDYAALCRSELELLDIPELTPDDNEEMTFVLFRTKT